MRRIAADLRRNHKVGVIFCRVGRAGAVFPEGAYFLSQGHVRSPVRVTLIESTRAEPMMGAVRLITGLPFSVGARFSSALLADSGIRYTCTQCVPLSLRSPTPKSSVVHLVAP